MNDEITRKDVAKAFILAVPATLIGLGFFGFMGFALYMIGG
jgi:preprotein translocase subunit Sss1